MKLADLRRITIKNGTRIRFRLSNGMECVVNEHGVAQVPALRAVTDINLEEELAGAGEFTVENVAAGDKNKTRAEILNREQMAALSGTKTAEAVHEEHDE